MSEGFLFSTHDIFNVVQARTETIKKRVQAIPPNTLLGASEDVLIQALVEEFWMNVPVIKEDEIHVADSGEVSVDVSGDSMRMIYDRSQPFYVPGNRTVIAVPFEGQVEFFTIRPSSFSLSPPRAEIGNGELLLTYVRTNPNAEEIKRSYHRCCCQRKEQPPAGGKQRHRRHRG